MVFLAGYLSENRALLVEQDSRLGPLRMPPLPYLAPDGRDVGDRARDRRHPARPGRRPPVLRRVPGDALRRDRPDQPRDHRIRPVPPRQRADGDAVRPHPDPDRHLGRPVRRPARRRASRSSRRCTRSRAAACSGSGSGRACPRSPAGRRSRRSTRTSRWRPSARSSASSASWRSSASTSSWSSAGCGSARPRRTTSGRCSRSGSPLVIGVQAFIIAAGNLKVLPLTGVTLPFISYGGSSLLANALVIGLLLALSDKGVEPPPLPRVGSRWRRPGRRSVRLMLGTARRAGRSAGRRSMSRSCVSLAFGLLAGAAGYWGVVEAPDLVALTGRRRRHRGRPDRAAREDPRPDRQDPGRQQDRRERRADPGLRRTGDQPGRRLRVLDLRPGGSRTGLRRRAQRPRRRRP